MNDDFDDDDDWKPPTEAELKVLAAKRERSDKISKKMGDYLLKGYRMLATTCRQCSTIELQDKQGQIYCVACQEIDCHETSKDDPVLSDQAAEKVLAESAFSSLSSQPRSESQNPDLIPGSSMHRMTPMEREEEESNFRGFGQNRNQTGSASTFPNPPQGVALGQPSSILGSLGAASRIQGSGDIPQLQLKPVLLSTPGSRIQDTESREILQNSRSILSAKLQWANQLLEAEQGVVSATNLAVLIRETASALHTVSSILQ